MLLFSIVTYIIYYILQSSILIYSNINNIFLDEFKLFYKEKNIYKNFCDINNITDLYFIRRKSIYRKIGYGGHPFKYCFSFPLDNVILLSPKMQSMLIEIFVFIHCRPEEFYERLISRKNMISSNNVKIIYITSKSKKNEVNMKLKFESNIYNDILQFNELSSYFNLSIQTAHMIIWSSSFNFKYLIKSDIDVFINIQLIENWFKYFYTKSKYFALGRISKTYILRNKRYSHYVPTEIIKESMYPPYLQGVGYIMPYNTVKQIIKSIIYAKPKIWIEDVFMGYLFKYNNITLIDISKYILRDIPNNLSKVMHSANKYMFIHGLYPIEIFYLNNSCKNRKYA